MQQERLEERVIVVFGLCDSLHGDPYGLLELDFEIEEPSVHGQSYRATSYVWEVRLVSNIDQIQPTEDALFSLI